MKIAPVLLGAIAAQESGDYSDYDAAAPAAGEDRWDSWGNDNNFLMASNDSGRGYTAKTALAVTCWESNNMGDLRHYNTQNDDGFGWGNIHHGHDQAADSAIVAGDTDDYQVGTYYMDQTATPNKVDLHSAMAFDNRYSGCIYEVSGWTYDADSYNRWWLIQYGADANGAFEASTGLDKSNADTIRVNWWHYFNAHVLVDNATADSTQAHKIAMANPQYEGLGYLNFICTFAKADAAALAGTPSSSNDAFNTARGSKNFNVFDTVTDNYSGGYAFSVGAGDSSSEEWYSTYAAADWTANYAAVSSFPHNDLGKDFRFNVRILHKGGDGDPTNATGKDSYYFYRVNRIDIDFPYDVRCPRESSNVAADSALTGATGTAGETFRCMDSANYNGHRGYYDNQTNAQTTPNEKENYPFYRENLANFAGSAGFCTTALSDGEWYQCGKNYYVDGLMNTYDEHAQQEFGTHQEFWFQFYYHFEITDATKRSNPTTITVPTDVQSVPFNYPNLLFNSFELTAVTFACSTANVFNNNVCS
jgi:hypothetical protein